MMRCVSPRRYAALASSSESQTFQAPNATATAKPAVQAMAGGCATSTPGIAVSNASASP
jgi:hypothetical protein